MAEGKLKSLLAFGGFAMLIFLVSCGPQATPTPGRRTYSAPPLMTIDLEKTYIATIETNKGTMKFRLLPELAPKTVNSFVFLAREGFYDGLTFHRVVAGFMAQGGAPLGDEGGDAGYTLPAEFSQEKHITGTLAMARKPEEPDSAGSQFYIALRELSFLDGEYTVFGQMMEGEEVLNQLTVREPGSEIAPDVILSITIEER